MLRSKKDNWKKLTITERVRENKGNQVKTTYEDITFRKKSGSSLLPWSPEGQRWGQTDIFLNAGWEAGGVQSLAFLLRWWAGQSVGGAGVKAQGHRFEVVCGGEEKPLKDGWAELTDGCGQKPKLSDANVCCPCNVFPSQHCPAIWVKARECGLLCGLSLR